MAFVTLAKATTRQLNVPPARLNLHLTPPPNARYATRHAGLQHPARTVPRKAVASEQLEDGGAHIASTEDAGSADDVPALLERADADIAAMRLTTPTGHSAWDRFKAVLRHDPDNTRARQGLQRIVVRYVELASSADAAGRPHRAAIYLSRAREVLFGSRESGRHIAIADETERLVTHGSR